MARTNMRPLFNSHAMCNGQHRGVKEHCDYSGPHAPVASMRPDPGLPEYKTHPTQSMEAEPSREPADLPRRERSVRLESPEEATRRMSSEETKARVARAHAMLDDDIEKRRQARLTLPSLARVMQKLFPNGPPPPLLLSCTRTAPPTTSYSAYLQSHAVSKRPSDDHTDPPPKRQRSDPPTSRHSHSRPPSDSTMTESSQTTEQPASIRYTAPPVLPAIRRIRSLETGMQRHQIQDHTGSEPRSIDLSTGVSHSSMDASGSVNRPGYRRFSPRPSHAHPLRNEYPREENPQRTRQQTPPITLPDYGAKRTDDRWRSYSPTNTQPETSYAQRSQAAPDQLQRGSAVVDRGQYRARQPSTASASPISTSASPDASPEASESPITPPDATYDPAMMYDRRAPSPGVCRDFDRFLSEAQNGHSDTSRRLSERHEGIPQAEDPRAVVGRPIAPLKGKRQPCMWLHRDDVRSREYWDWPSMSQRKLFIGRTRNGAGLKSFADISPLQMADGSTMASSIYEAPIIEHKSVQKELPKYKMKTNVGPELRIHCLRGVFMPVAVLRALVNPYQYDELGVHVMDFLKHNAGDLPCLAAMSLLLRGLRLKTCKSADHHDCDDSPRHTAMCALMAASNQSIIDYKNSVTATLTSMLRELARTRMN